MQEEFKEVFSGLKRTRGNLVPLLQKVQGKWGYLSKESIYQISRFLGVTENEVFGVATFYAQFRFTPPGDHSIKVCLGTACYVRGIERVLDKLKEVLKIDVGKTTEDRKFSLEVVRCIGCCSLAPCMFIDHDPYSALTPKKAISALNKYAPVSTAEVPAEEIEITGEKGV